MIPAHNVDQYLAETLESLRAQTERSWECVVVDDGSTDRTLSVAREVAAADTRIRVIQQLNGGAAAARNAGFRATNPSSSYVTFMDSDDVWLPHAFETLLERLADRPNAVGAHGLAELIDANGRLIEEGSYSEKGRTRLGRKGKSLVVWPLDWPTDFDVLINGNVLFPPGLVLARRLAYERAGPFDEVFNGPEDWDMLIRLSRYGHLEFVNEVILHYRRHETNLGARTTVPRQAWLVRCKAFHSPENSAEQRRAAKLGWRAYQKRMAGEAWTMAREAATARRFAMAARQLARIPAAGVRYVRGYPSPRVQSSPLRW